MKTLPIRTLALGLLAACVDTSQRDARAALYAAGSSLDGPIEAQDDVSVTLARAQLAFGPLTLCAGLQAGELCDEALLEWNDARVVDVLDGTPVPVGQLEGVTGKTQSYMYDLAIVSLLTSERPLVLDAASELGGRSVRLEGTAERAGRSLRFRIELAIAQSSETERGVPVVRKSSGEDFSHAVQSRDDSLLVRFDARPWLESVDFATLLARCDVDLDCGEVVILDEDSQAGAAVRNAIVAGERPSFTWNSEDAE